MSRLPQAEIRRLLLRNVDDKWRTATTYYVAFRKHGHSLGLGGWERIALNLERLANDGEIEIRVRGNRRYFRRAQ